MPNVRYEFMCFTLDGDQMVTEFTIERVRQMFRFECLPTFVVVRGQTGEYFF